MTGAVIFDFYGTIAVADAWPETPQDVLTRHGYRLDPAAIARWNEEARRGVDHSRHSVDRATYEAWDRSRCLALVRAAGVSPAHVPRVMAEMWAAKKPTALVAYPETVEVLGELRARGVVLALCSNWDWDLDEDARRVGVGDLFQVMVSSARAGARKPHPRMFQAVLGACGVAAGDALFVGDSIGADVAGALAAGMQAAYLRRPAPAPWPGLGASSASALGNGTGVPDGAAVISDLRGVLGIVGD